MPQIFDLIIVGGGVVGAGLALGLQESGLKIALVDARNPSANDPRLFALNYGSCQFLKNTGLWSRLAEHAAPIHQVHVTHKGHFGSVSLKHEDLGLRELGHVIPAKFIEAAMNERLQYLTTYRPAKLTHITFENDLAQLAVNTDEVDIKLQAPLVIGADGTSSTVREQLGIEVDEHDYGQTAIVTISHLQRHHDYIAYERFVPKGAIAMLPLPEDHCATIWTAENSFAKELLAMDDTAFIEQLQQQFGYRLGRLKAVSKRHSYPLRMLQAKQHVSKSVYLLGNSAHTLHPIAAQGFNLALYEVAILVEGILEQLNQGVPLTTHTLNQINIQTQKQQSFSTKVSHKLAQVFTKDSFLSNLAIHLGMAGIDTVPAIKRNFMAEIMGRKGIIPRLCLSTMDYEENVKGSHQ